MEITVDLVRRLVDGQFPQWSVLPITPVVEQGHDNRTFRLGHELAVRLPTHFRYAPAVAKEERALPLIRDHVTVAVPSVVASGCPTTEYPLPWSVRTWMRGRTADVDPCLDRELLACDVGVFLRELREVPTGDGPVPGDHSFYRGAHVSVYEDDVVRALSQLTDTVDVAACRSVWDAAVASPTTSRPVWVHGDMAVGNLLTVDGRLEGVIDFGACCVGDPACDLVLAWTLFGGASRDRFREVVGLPDAFWVRARGWALWKALINLAGDPEDTTQLGILREVLEGSAPS